MSTPAQSTAPQMVQPVSAGVNKGAEMLESLLASKGIGTDDAGQPAQPITQFQQPVQPQTQPQLQPQSQPQPQPQHPQSSADAPVVQPVQAPSDHDPAQRPSSVPVSINYSSRFAPQGKSDDPLADIQALPDLPPDQPVQDPQNMGEQQNHAWAALRAQANQNRRNAEQYLRQYNDLVEKTKGFQAERTEYGSKLNEKDKEIESLRNEIGRLDLSRSPEFKEKYDAPIYAIHDDMVRTLLDNGMENSAANDLAGQILSSSPDDIPGIISELPTHVQGILMIRSQDAAKFMDARQHALDDWRTSQDGLAAVANRGSAMIEAQRRDKLAKAALDYIRSVPGDQKIPAYQVIEPQFVADREKHEKEFMSWVQEAPQEQLYAAALEGFMAPKTYEMLSHYAEENARLKAALYNRGRAASPTIDPGQGYVPPPPPPRQQQGQPVPVQVPVDPAQSIVRGIFEKGGMLPPGM